MSNESFQTYNATAPVGPVVLSVPHAGRAYDAAIIAQLRVPVMMVRALEDRDADALARDAIAAGVPAIVSCAPRLLIDLNRAPDDFDHGALDGGRHCGAPTSAKARAGLGLIPTRLWGVGPIWKVPPTRADMMQRLHDHHAPYHAAIAAALAIARQHWGAAVLVDLHSMPPVGGSEGPDMVVGDRFGATAAAQVTAIAEATLTEMGFRVAINTPYAGGYIVARHGRPDRAVHALQIEVDRRLYLDARLDRPGAGLARVQHAIARLVATLADEIAPRLAHAAE